MFYSAAAPGWGTTGSCLIGGRDREREASGGCACRGTEGSGTSRRRRQQPNAMSPECLPPPRLSPQRPLSSPARRSAAEAPLGRSQQQPEMEEGRGGPAAGRRAPGAGSLFPSQHEARGECLALLMRWSPRWVKVVSHPLPPRETRERWARLFLQASRSPPQASRMRASKQTSLNLFCLLWLLLLLKAASSSPLLRGNDPPPSSLPSGLYKGHTCIGCVLVVSVIEQLAQWHNSTVKAAMERLCSYIPEKLQGFCYILAELYGPHIAELIDREMNADVVCHSLKLCKQDPGQPLCHLYSPPKVGLSTAIRKARRIVKTSKDLKNFMGFSSVCAFPLLANLCEKIKYVLSTKLPFEDLDGDKFSTFPTLRGYHWRGRDCDDRDNTVYPGRRPDNWDEERDSNCNGIWGVDPKDGIPYEEKFCKGSDSQGVVLFGDSAGAHFHIPPEWMTVSQMSVKSFANLPVAFTNELDWPQFSEITGFLNSTIGGWTDSLYLRLRSRNRCNHRDLQNISKNGGSSGNLLHLIKSLARNQLLDNPAIVIYATIGNDVCNGNNDTLAYMTTPKEMLSNVMQALRYLDTRLPNGSHVILTGLVDGRFLWDNLHDRYHPLGQLNRDITYSQLYSFLDCLQVSPCRGWMTPNETLRNLTSERALQLSNVLKEIARSEKFANFDIFYMDFPLRQTAEKWRRMGGEPWQLIEPVDGFHPSQIAAALGTSITWQKALQEWPQVLGKENPFNEQIEAIFKDQGGH